MEAFFTPAVGLLLRLSARAMRNVVWESVLFMIEAAPDEEATPRPWNKAAIHGLKKSKKAKQQSLLSLHPTRPPA